MKLSKLAWAGGLAAALTIGSAVFAQSKVTLNGAGASFPYPLYSKWISEYQKVAPQVALNYQSVGSGAGVRQFIDKTVDFGASDAPLTDDQTKKAVEKGITTVHIPTVLGAVVVTYNLGAVKDTLKLSSDVVADIFLGKIKKWNDAKLVELNKGVKLPDSEITVVHRSDGSGTTAVFADYLAKVSAEWKTKVGVGSSLSWPTGLGAKGNEGVAGVVKQTEGTIGYTELTYAKTNGLPMAQVKNKAGKFVAASTKSVTEAAAGAMASMPEDFKISITDAAGAESYPIASFTYLLVTAELPAAKGEALVKFLNWAVTDGQKFAEPLDYATLPKSLADKVVAKIKTLKVGDGKTPTLAR